MAVKVVDFKPKRPKRTECGHCGCTLEYMPIDVHEYHGRDYSGGPDGKKWINCPNCNKEVILESW